MPYGITNEGIGLSGRVVPDLKVDKWHRWAANLEFKIDLTVSGEHRGRMADLYQEVQCRIRGSSRKACEMRDPKVFDCEHA